ncbi:MAG: right-handed parallel beta-helix repeat-containing protein [Chitinophagales bacterium]|nr:right-handed parallel beta-helix repeat-containing protein [Hyphomicrobiales bacterium]
MTMDRRSFFAGGAGLGAGLGLGTAAMLAGPQAEAAPIAPAMMGRSVLDFGVEANTETDQSPALQRALNEIAASGHPAFLPQGIYVVQGLQIPNGAHLVGSGAKLLFEDGGCEVEGITAHISHLAFEGRGNSSLKLAGGSFAALLAADHTNLTLEHCSFQHASGWAVFAENSILTMNSCLIQNVAGGVFLNVKAPTDGGIISGLRVTQCASAGIEAKGRAIVTGNMIDGCGNGLKLGDPKGTSHILASQNSITNCRVGIACEAEGDYIFATLNMIQGAKDGAIRAIADGKLVGPDLTQQSAESYRNLAIAGNVAL